MDGGFAQADPIERFVFWTVRFSIVGLLLFVCILVGAGLAESLYDLTPEIQRFFGGTIVGDQITGGWRRANWLVYTFSPDRPYQNHGFMWEPAAYAVMVTMALWGRFLRGQVRMDLINILLVVAIVSTVSTTALVALTITVVWWLSRLRGAGALALLFVVPVAATIFTEADFLLAKITDELRAESSRMQWSLSRWDSFKIDMDEFLTQPVLGIGVVTETRPLAGRLPSNNGLTDFLTRYGVLMTGLFYTLFVASMRRYYGANLLSVILFTLVLAVFAWSEKYFELPFFYVWAFAGFFHIKVSERVSHSTATNFSPYFPSKRGGT